VKINVEELKNKLEVAKLGLSAKGIINEYNRYMIKDNTLLTTNDEIVVIVPDIGLDFKEGIAIKSEELLSLLKKATNSKEIEVTLDDELLLSWKKTKSGLRYYDLNESLFNEDVQELLAPDSKFGWVELPQVFTGALTLVKGCAAKDIYAEVLNSICITGSGLTACDNYRISTYDFGEDVFDKNFLLPLSTANILIRFKPVEVGYGENDSWVYFRNKLGYTLGCRVYSGEYPELDDFLYPEEGGTDILFSQAMVDTITRAEVFVDTSDDQKLIDIKITTNEIEVSSEKEEGWLKETGRIKYAGKPFSFKIDIDSLREILLHVNKGQMYKSSIRFEDEQFVYVNVIGD